MRLRDFENRFEDSLKLNKLTYTVDVKEDPAGPTGTQWTWKHFRIAPRLACEAPLLVTLARHTRSGRFYRRASTSCTCFVVPPSLWAKSRKAQNGLRAVWSYLRIHCLPL